MDKVTFTENNHRYTHYTGKIYTSTTTIISKYKQPFDEDYWSLYKALEKYIRERKGDDYFVTVKKRVGYENIIATQLQYVGNMDLLAKYQEEILEEWDKKREDACAKGTAFHKQMEYDTNSTKFDLSSNLPIQIERRDLSHLEDGVYAELVVWNEHYEIAGQADKVIREDGVVHIDDYKTSEFINKKSFKHHIKGYQMMKEPLEHLMDCNFLHYTLQLSIYAYMLEEFGMEVGTLRIYHQKSNTWLKVEYLRNEVILLLDNHKELKIKL